MAGVVVNEVYSLACEGMKNLALKPRSTSRWYSFVLST